MICSESSPTCFEYLQNDFNKASADLRRAIELSPRNVFEAASQNAAAGRNLRTGGGKVVAFVGEPPKNVAITEFDSLDQAVAWRNSAAFKDLTPQRDKAIKIIRQYTVEAAN